MLYEIAILEKPTKEQAKNGKTEKLILGPCAIVAEDDRSAFVSLVMDHSEELKEVDKTRMEVLVRPFVM